MTRRFASLVTLCVVGATLTTLYVGYSYQQSRPLTIRTFGPAALSVSSPSKDDTPKKFSCGVLLEMNLGESDTKVLEVGVTSKVGTWRIRIDGGPEDPSPRRFGLPIRWNRFKVHGGPIRCFIYSDNPDSTIQLSGAALRSLQDGDEFIPWGQPKSIEDSERHESFLRSTLRHQANIDTHDPTSVIADKLREYTHQNSSLLDPGQTRFNSDTADWLHTLATQSEARINGDCGNFTSAMRHFCLTMGIDARPVAIGNEGYFEGDPIHESHALLEVYDSDLGAWVLQDPTFNISFQSDDGTPLGIEQLYWAHQNGVPFRIKEGKSKLDGRSISEYHISINDILEYAYAPSRMTGQGHDVAEFNPRGRTTREIGALMTSKVDGTK